MKHGGRVGFIVHLRCNADGEVRRVIDADGVWPRDENTDCEFLWSEGNYACDCNRFLFFERAGGATENEIDAMEDVPCGDSRYTVVGVTTLEGKPLVYEGE